MRRFPGRPASVPAARRFVSNLLRGRRDRETVALLVTELASNAVRHARTAFTVSVTISTVGVHVEVFDGSPVQVSAPVAAAPLAESGRGLLLVAALAYAWGCKPAGEGKVMWFDTDTRTAI